MKFLQQYSVTFYVIFGLTLLYTIAKTYIEGNDINVYLFASQHVFGEENIYTNNPFNFYLYSPLFAILLKPWSLFSLEIGRVLWGVTNLILTFRLWFLIVEILNLKSILSRKKITFFTILTAFIAAGFVNHNITLGQITILILWLSLEGCYRILFKKQEVLGAALLAIGINIKIIPIIFLYYLFLKGKIRAIIYSTSFVIISLLLPTLLIGPNRNLELHSSWFETINPTKSKYVFESGNGTQSLNATIPAYFFEFEDMSEVSKSEYPRTILSIEYSFLKTILQFIRISLALSLLYLIFYKRKSRTDSAYFFFWEFAYTCLLIVLIFPHQQKYAMLLMVPSGIYVFLHLLSWINNRQKERFTFTFKIILSILICCLFISGINGRDIIGSDNVEVLDYYHVFGLINLVMAIGLIYLKPDALIFPAIKKREEE